MQSNMTTLVRVGAIQTVLNPFPRRHSELSPSECGRLGGPSHTTQKPSGICPPGTHARQNEVVCDRRALKYINTYSSAKKYNYTSKIVFGRKYIPHSQSSLKVSVDIYILHSHSKENVWASWPNANNFQDKLLFCVFVSLAERWGVANIFHARCVILTMSVYSLVIARE